LRSHLAAGFRAECAETRTRCKPSHYCSASIRASPYGRFSRLIRFLRHRTRRT
jgi:hypothetical protein